MTHIRLVSLAVIAAFVLSGCFYAHVKQPLDTNVDKTVMGRKTGRATNYSVLWVAAWGDASTSAAAANGGLTTVHHMDNELFSVFFGMYTESTTIVYGE